MNVGDLVGVGDDGGDPPGKDGPGKFGWGHEGAFDVDVRVDEARGHVGAVQVHLFVGRVSRTQGHDGVLVDDDVGVLDVSGVDVDDSGVAKGKGGRLVSTSNGEAFF